MKGKHNAYENTLDAALILETTNEIGASKSHKPILFSFYLDIIHGKILYKCPTSHRYDSERL